MGNDYSLQHLTTKVQQHLKKHLARIIKNLLQAMKLFPKNYSLPACITSCADLKTGKNDHSFFLPISYAARAGNLKTLRKLFTHGMPRILKHYEKSYSSDICVTSNIKNKSCFLPIVIKLGTTKIWEYALQTISAHASKIQFNTHSKKLRLTRTRKNNQWEERRKKKQYRLTYLQQQMIMLPDLLWTNWGSTNRFFRQAPPLENSNVYKGGSNSQINITNGD